MNHNKKIKLSFLLLSVIILNLYIIHKFYTKKEGFIKETIKGVLSIIPIKPVQKFLKKEVNAAKGPFEAILYLAVGIFKLIVLIGVMPFVMIVLVKVIVTGGFMSILSGTRKFVSFMVTAPKPNIDMMSAANFGEINTLKQEIENLKEKSGSCGCKK
tara:strand:+ start:14 stop:484 length:471 start_codon:yes stop_codon:yes gene_type:complete